MATQELNDPIKSEQWNLLELVRQNWCNNQERLIKRMKYAFIIYGFTFFFVFILNQNQQIFVTLPEIGKINYNLRPFINLVLILLAGESLFETTMLVKMRVNYTNAIQQLIEDNNFYKGFLEVDILPSSTHLLDLRILDNLKIEGNKKATDNTGIVGKLNTNFLMILLFALAMTNIWYSFSMTIKDSSTNNLFILALNIFIFFYTITVLKKVYNYNKNGILFR